MKILAITACTLIGLGTTSVALSQTPPDGGTQGGTAPDPRAAIAQVWGEDIQKFCGNVDHDGRRQCVQDNVSKMSQPCQDVLKPILDRMQNPQGGSQ
jgi:hypothetical protein